MERNVRIDDSYSTNPGLWKSDNIWLSNERKTEKDDAWQLTARVKTCSDEIGKTLQTGWGSRGTLKWAI